MPSSIENNFPPNSAQQSIPKVTNIRGENTNIGGIFKNRLEKVVDACRNGGPYNLSRVFENPKTQQSPIRKAHSDYCFSGNLSAHTHTDSTNTVGLREAKLELPRFQRPFLSANGAQQRPTSKIRSVENRLRASHIEHLETRSETVKVSPASSYICVPPLVRHLLLLSESFRHELQLIPLIANAISSHFGSTVDESEQQLSVTLRKDLRIAYTLLANDVRGLIVSWVRDEQARGSMSYTCMTALPSLLSPVSSQATVPPNVQAFFTELQLRVHSALSWNSSVLILRHSEIIKSVCNELGRTYKADTVTDGIFNLPEVKTLEDLNENSASMEDQKGPKFVVTTPLLEGYTEGALFPSSLDSSRHVQAYNAKIMALSKWEIVLDANKELKKGIIHQRALRPRTAFTIQRSWRGSGNQTQTINCKTINTIFCG